MFDISKGKLTLKPEDIMLASFNKIYKKDRSTVKADSLKLFMYIHLVSQIDKNAPFNSADFNEVRALVKKEVYGDFNYKFVGNRLVDEGTANEMIELYVKANETAARRLELSYNKKLDQFKNLLDTTIPVINEDINEKSGTTSFSSNSDIIMKISEGILKMIKARDVLSAIASGEEIKEGRVKANAAKSILEDKHAKK